MNRGVLLFAHNNKKIDYIKQAIFCAKKIKKHLDLPVALATNSKNYLKRAYPDHFHLFDYVIDNDYETTQMRRFSNGSLHQTLPWNNFTRCESYDITPFDKTLVIDTDFLVGNDNLLECFKDDSLKINKDIVDCNPQRGDTKLQRISDSSLDMYWATVFYFSKNNPVSKTFFDLVRHIRDNWSFYKLQYQMNTNHFRNDHAFTIALHLLENPQIDLPCKLFFTTDKDKLLSINAEKYNFLISTTEFLKSDTVCSVENVNIHIMNKFTLMNEIDKVLAYD